MTTTERQTGGLNTPEALEKVAHLFGRNLLTNKTAMQYLAERGIDESLVRSNQVGFCPPYYNHWFDLIKGRITVTIRDVHGEVVAFAGRQYEPMRKITHRAFWEAYGNKPATAQKRIDFWDRGKWINEPYSKSKHLFQLYEAKDYCRERNYINLVEGYFDAKVMYSKGLENTSALCGVALSEHHISLISRFCEHVVLVLDGDEAGLKAAEKHVPLIREADLIPHVVYMPPGLDPDDFLLKYGGKVLRRGIENMIAEGKDELRIKIREN